VITHQRLGIILLILVLPAACGLSAAFEEEEKKMKPRYMIIISLIVTILLSGCDLGTGNPAAPTRSDRNRGVPTIGFATLSTGSTRRLTAPCREPIWKQPWKRHRQQPRISLSVSAPAQKGMPAHPRLTLTTKASNISHRMLTEDVRERSRFIQRQGSMFIRCASSPRKNRQHHHLQFAGCRILVTTDYTVSFAITCAISQNPPRPRFVRQHLCHARV